MAGTPRAPSWSGLCWSGARGDGQGEDVLKDRRDLMKGYPMAFGEDPRNPELQSDQRKGVAAPPLQKPVDAGALETVALPAPTRDVVASHDQFTVMGQRQSRRSYASDPLSQEELSFLLWATQGVHVANTEKSTRRRTVSSAGSRHPYETYLHIARVDGVDPDSMGIFRSRMSSCSLTSGRVFERSSTC